MDDALRDKLLRIYADSKTIAVVGASADEAKPSFRMPRYLQSQGYLIRPVNPKSGVILGEQAVASLADVEAPIDVVDVFRPADGRRASRGRPWPPGPGCSGSRAGSRPRK